MARKPDTGLRRMIVNLAGMRERDVAAVLGSLSSSQRQRVQEMLGDFSSFGLPDPGATPAPVESFSAKGLSLALVRLLEKNPGSAEITAHCWAQLRECVANLKTEVPHPAISAANNRSIGAAIGRPR